MSKFEKAIIVKGKTKLEQLTEQYNTKQQAQFTLERQRENVTVQKDFLSENILGSMQSNRAKMKKNVGSGEFTDFELENQRFYSVLESVQKTAAQYLKVKIIENSFLPSFIFSENDLVIVIGQDGLVANTAKYTNQLPIIGINPDPDRFDGILLPFDLKSFEATLFDVLADRYQYQLVTMAEVLLNDGQRLLAFNDFFIGPISHTSARYLITFNGNTDTHSSSGIIVSTGAGSTGWMSSLFNMANGIYQSFGSHEYCQKPNLEWNTEQLIFIVREPFQSKTSQISIAGGVISPDNELIIESLMAKTGIIFSDGLESDNLKFNSGTIAKIGIAKEKAKLVVPFNKQPAHNSNSITSTWIKSAVSNPKKSVLFEEHFYNSNKNWWIGENNRAKISIEHGSMIFENKVKEGTVVWYGSALGLNPKEDFEIEWGMCLQKNSGNYGFGFMWGIDEKNYYAFCLSANSYFRINKREKGNWVEVHPWELNSNIALEGSFNLIKMIQKEQKYEFIINDKSVLKIELPILGATYSKIGFILDYDLTILVDFVKIVQ